MKLVKGSLMQGARDMYERYSQVGGEGNHPWLAWRDIVVARKVPRMILVQVPTHDAFSSFHSLVSYEIDFENVDEH
jgi:hypothetical protein